jgi:hypothetical protein
MINLAEENPTNKVSSEWTNIVYLLFTFTHGAQRT